MNRDEEIHWQAQIQYRNCCLMEPALHFWLLYMEGIGDGIKPRAAAGTVYRRVLEMIIAT